MLIVFSSGSQRFIGEVEEAPTGPNEYVLVCFPMQYIEQITPQGPMIGMPPPVLPAPTENIPMAISWWIEIEGPRWEQIIAAYAQATQAVRAVTQHIIPASLGVLRRLKPIPNGRQ